MRSTSNGWLFTKAAEAEHGELTDYSAATEQLAIWAANGLAVRSNFVAARLAEGENRTQQTRNPENVGLITALVKIVVGRIRGW
jgi:hypothetical protein